MAEFHALHGTTEILAKMKSLGPVIAGKVAKSAMRKGAIFVRDAAKANALRLDDPKTGTQIAANITVQYASKISRREQGVAYRVGVMGGAKQYAKTKANRRKGLEGKTYHTDGRDSNPGGNTYYWRFVELGTSRTRAQPFLVPALAGNVDRVITTVMTELNKGLDRALKKAAK